MNSRRRFLLSLGAASTVGLAGCRTGSDSPVNETPAREEVTPTQNTTYTENGSRTNNSTDQGVITVEEEVTPSPNQTEDMDLTGREIYFNQIHGENDEILEEVQGTEGEHSISFQAIDNALEEGFQNGGRNQAIAAGLETASQEYESNNTETYWERHQHIMSALHQTLEQKNGEQWDFEIDSRLDAVAQSPDGVIKYSHINVETENGETERGNTEYQTIRGALDERYDHTTHIQGQDTAPEDGTIKRLLESVASHPDRYAARSLIDKDAIDNAIDGYGANEEGSYDQTGMNIGILVGGGINEEEYEENAITPENLLVSEDGREEEILEIVDEYEEDGDLALRQRMREEYFNNGHDEYEASETNITEEGIIEYMEGIDDFDMSEEVANT